MILGIFIGRLPRVQATFTKVEGSVLHPPRIATVVTEPPNSKGVFSQTCMHTHEVRQLRDDYTAAAGEWFNRTNPLSHTISNIQQ